MSFQTYLSNIQAQTGKTPADFRVIAEQKGFTEGGEVKADVKAGAVVEWLKNDFGLGHGHAMAIWALLSGKKSEDSV
jgi:hypothetical protein